MDPIHCSLTMDPVHCPPPMDLVHCPSPMDPVQFPFSSSTNITTCLLDVICFAYFLKVKPASKGGVGHESQSLSYLLNRYPHTSLTQLQHTLKQHDWSLVRTVTHLEQTSRCLRSRTNASRFCKHHCMSKKSRMCEACYMRMVDTGASSKEIQSFFLEVSSQIPFVKIIM